MVAPNRNHVLILLYFLFLSTETLLSVEHQIFSLHVFNLMPAFLSFGLLPVAATPPTPSFFEQCSEFYVACQDTEVCEATACLSQARSTYVSTRIVCKYLNTS